MTPSKRAPQGGKATDAAEGAGKGPPKGAAQDVVGFGCPAVGWPHHIRVIIPAGRSGTVVVIEDFGIAGQTAGDVDEVERCSLPRERWNLIADPLRREFNERLRAIDLPTSKWASGQNKVERILGLELLALAWPMSQADESDLAAILSSWQALRPEERWWLAGRVGANPTPKVCKGLALLLSGGPVKDEDARGRARFPAQRPSEQLPLFGGKARDE